MVFDRDRDFLNNPPQDGCFELEESDSYIPAFFLPDLRKNVCKSSSLEKFHQHPKLITYKIAFIHLHHVVMLIVPHYHNLRKMTKDKWLIIHSMLFCWCDISPIRRFSFSLPRLVTFILRLRVTIHDLNMHFFTSASFYNSRTDKTYYWNKKLFHVAILFFSWKFWAVWTWRATLKFGIETIISLTKS